jgi:hypothetical protein
MKVKEFAEHLLRLKNQDAQIWVSYDSMTPTELGMPSTADRDWDGVEGYIYRIG